MAYFWDVQVPRQVGLGYKDPKTGQEKTKTVWNSVRRESKAIAFQVRTDEGPVEVEPADATNLAIFTNTQRIELSPDAITGQLAERFFRERVHTSGKRVWIEEGVLEPGRRCHVVGDNVAGGPADGGSYRAAAVRSVFTGAREGLAVLAADLVENSERHPIGMWVAAVVLAAAAAGLLGVGLYQDPYVPLDLLGRLLLPE